MMSSYFTEELAAIATGNPDACVLIYRSDCPAETVIFDCWGPKRFVKEEVAECNKHLCPWPTGIEALFEPDVGSFDYMSVKAAVRWLTDQEMPWKVANLGEYGAYAYIMQAPRRSVRAFKARIDSL